MQIQHRPPNDQRIYIVDLTPSPGSVGLSKPSNGAIFIVLNVPPTANVL